MRPREFWEAFTAHQQEVEDNRIHIGELVRGATQRLFNLQLKRSDRILDPTKFWPMPWDKASSDDDEVRRLNNLSDEERQAEVQKFFDRLNGKQRTEF